MIVLRFAFVICSVALFGLLVTMFLSADVAVPVYVMILTMVPVAVFAVFFYLSFTNFRRYRLFWVSSIILSVGVAYIYFGGYVVNEEELECVSIDYTGPSPIVLWQKPWLAHRVYFDIYQELCSNESGVFDKLISLFGLLLSIGLPLVIGFSFYRIWIPLNTEG